MVAATMCLRNAHVGRNCEFEGIHDRTQKCRIQFMYYHGISKTNVMVLIVLIFRSALQARTHIKPHGGTK